MARRRDILTRRTIAEPATILTGVPDVDRARVFAEDVARSAAASAWGLVRYDLNGAVCEMVIPHDTADAAQMIEWLKAEKLLQDRRGGEMPRVVRTAVPTPAFVSALTVVYGDGDGISGIMVVMRDGTQGPYNSLDDAMLQSSLESGSELLSRLRVFDGEQTAKERATQRSAPAHFVLNEALEIELAYRPPETDENEIILSLLTGERHLPPVLESAVRSLTATWSEDATTRHEGTAVPLPFLLVRVVPLTARDGYRIGVFIQRFQSRNAINWAAKRFSMSPREIQILALVLQGLGTPEIATTLGIAESTAHDHVKRMLIKTKARNRVEMAAKALGWRAAG